MINFARLFTGLGKMIGGLNELNTYRGSTISTRIATLRTAVTVSPDLNSGLTKASTDLVRGCGVWVVSLSSQASALIVAEVKADTNLASLDLNTCLTELVRQMSLGSESLAAATCTTTVSVITGSSDVGFITSDIDPSTGVRSNFLLPDVLLTTATSTGFTLLGLASAGSTDPTWPAGAGLSTTIPLTDLDVGIGDPGFEAWTNPTTPVYWVVVSGAVAQVAGSPYAGAGSVCGITGGATTEINQAVSTTQFQPYLISVWVKKTATGANTGSLVVSLRTSLGVLIGTAITVAMSAITTSWVRYTGVVVAPATTALLDLQFNGGAGDVINVSAVNLITLSPLYSRGLSVLALQGTIAPAVLDTWKVTTVADASLTSSLHRGLERLLGISGSTATIPTSGAPTQSNALVS